MANALPQSKAAEAFAQMAKLTNRGGQPDEFALARFERDARASLSVDALISYQLLGIVSMLRWSLDGLRQNFERALAISASAEVLTNYGRALSDSNLPAEGAEMLERAIEKEPENLSLLRGAISYRFCSGNWARAAELLKILEQRVPANDATLKVYYGVLGMAEKLGIRNDTVIGSMTCALQFLAQRKIRAVSYSHDVEKLSGEECIYVAIGVNLPEEEAALLDEEFTPHLFEGMADLQLSSFVLSIQAEVHDAAQ